MSPRGLEAVLCPRLRETPPCLLRPLAPRTILAFPGPERRLVSALPPMASFCVCTFHGDTSHSGSGSPTAVWPRPVTLSMTLFHAVTAWRAEVGLRHGSVEGTWGLFTAPLMEGPCSSVGALSPRLTCHAPCVASGS